MPTYEYECGACGHRFDLFQKITEGPVKRCPDCRRLKARRLIGRGAGIIFKGSGFYETDYRSENYNKRLKEEKGEPHPKPGKEKPETTSAKSPGDKKTAAREKTGAAKD